ncbi:hypothetical protein WA158_005652 [Blastocystis sp. Blastoise]
MSLSAFGFRKGFHFQAKLIRSLWLKPSQSLTQQMGHMTMKTMLIPSLNSIRSVETVLKPVQDIKNINIVVQNENGLSQVKVIDEDVKLLNGFPKKTSKEFQKLIIYGKLKQFFETETDYQDYLLFLKTNPTQKAFNDYHESIYQLYIQMYYKETLNKVQEVIAYSDLTKPHMWYPDCRKMKRHIIYHKGGTNSGKTYQAIQDLKAAKNGIYCAPLRLLAGEIYMNLKENGIRTELLTGIEMEKDAEATHTSCTVEMCNIDKYYDVCILDEIQMLGDSERGAAWSRVLLGVRAKTIHICGDSTVEGIVKKMVTDCGDTLEMREYKRFKPLEVIPSLNNNLKQIQDGDCLIAFSRQQVLLYKHMIESVTKKKCCVIYGMLPPETRYKQASLFNDKSSNHTVLIATDAIGMGLNLNIHRIIFTSLYKYTPVAPRVPLSIPLFKQISGRAGRRNCNWPSGQVTTLQSNDFPLLSEYMSSSLPNQNSAILFPPFQQIFNFASNFPNSNYSQILTNYKNMVVLDSMYNLQAIDDILKISKLLEDHNLILPLSLMFIYTQIPIRLNFSKENKEFVLHMADCLLKNIDVDLDKYMSIPSTSPLNHATLREIESKLNRIESYIWLVQRLQTEGKVISGIDTGKARAELYRNRAVKYIQTALEIQGLKGSIKQVNTHRRVKTRSKPY